MIYRLQTYVNFVHDDDYANAEKTSKYIFKNVNS